MAQCQSGLRLETNQTKVGLFCKWINYSDFYTWSAACGSLFQCHDCFKLWLADNIVFYKYKQVYVTHSIWDVLLDVNAYPVQCCWSLLSSGVFCMKASRKWFASRRFVLKQCFTLLPALSLLWRALIVKRGPIALVSMWRRMLSFVTFSSLSVSCEPAAMMRISMDLLPSAFSTDPTVESSDTSTPTIISLSHGKALAMIITQSFHIIGHRNEGGVLFSSPEQQATVPWLQLLTVFLPFFHHCVHKHWGILMDGTVYRWNS